jgi:hypothetical protein
MRFGQSLNWPDVGWKLKGKETNMKILRYLAVTISFGVLGCGAEGPVEGEPTGVEQSALDLTDRAIRFNNSGNCIRFANGNLRINTCPTPTSQLWTLVETSPGTGRYRVRMPNGRCIKIMLNPIDGQGLITEWPCGLGTDTQWQVYAGTLDVTFQLESVAYPGRCMHEDVNTYGVVQLLKTRTCLSGDPAHQKQRLFLDSI